MGPRLLSRGVKRRWSGCPLGSRSFNGAAASQPRSPATPELPQRPTLRASMGPRLLSRGVSGQPRHQRPGTALLQWGRGFSAAESQITAKRRVISLSASMGPRLLSRGVRRQRSRGRSTPPRFNGAAASQPRSRCSNRRPAGFFCGFNGAAASQPRSPERTGT